MKSLKFVQLIGSLVENIEKVLIRENKQKHVDNKPIE